MTGAVWLTEADVAETVALPDAVDAVRAALIAEHEGSAQTMAKTALAWGGGHTLHALGGLDRSTGFVATKTWAHTAGGAEPVLAVWDAETGRLVAMIEAFALGQLRTAAVSAVAIEAMAAPDASTVAIIGTGKQALPQVAAALDRRAIAEVRVFSPTPAHREAFAERLRPHVATVVVCDAPPTADIVITATRARQPVLHQRRPERAGRRPSGRSPPSAPSSTPTSPPTPRWSSATAPTPRSPCRTSSTAPPRSCR